MPRSLTSTLDDRARKLPKATYVATAGRQVGHTRELEGIAPTGHSATTSGITMSGRGRKIVEDYTEWDALGLMHRWRRSRDGLNIAGLCR